MRQIGHLFFHGVCTKVSKKHRHGLLHSHLPGAASHLQSTRMFVSWLYYGSCGCHRRKRAFCILKQRAYPVIRFMNGGLLR